MNSGKEPEGFWTGSDGSESELQIVAMDDESGNGTRNSNSTRVLPVTSTSDLIVIDADDDADNDVTTTPSVPEMAAKPNGLIQNSTIIPVTNGTTKQILQMDQESGNGTRNSKSTRVLPVTSNPGLIVIDDDDGGDDVTMPEMDLESKSQKIDQKTMIKKSKLDSMGTRPNGIITNSTIIPTIY